MTWTTTAGGAALAALLAASAAAQDAAQEADGAAPAEAAAADEPAAYDAYAGVSVVSRGDDGAYALENGAVSGAALLEGRVRINGADAGDVADVILSEFGFGQFITYGSGANLRYVTFAESDVESGGDGVVVTAARADGDAAPRIPPEVDHTLSSWLLKTVRFADGDAGSDIVDVVFAPDGMMELAIVDASNVGGSAREAVPATALIEVENGDLRAVGRWADAAANPGVDGV